MIHHLECFGLKAPVLTHCNIPFFTVCVPQKKGDVTDINNNINYLPKQRELTLSDYIFTRWFADADSKTQNKEPQKPVSIKVYMLKI